MDRMIGRSALLAAVLALWAPVGAEVCDALCAAAAQPSCHQVADAPEPEPDACCADAVDVFSGADRTADPMPVLAFDGRSASAALATPSERAMRPAARPPDWVSTYRSENPPLLI